MDHVRIIDQELAFAANRPEFHLAFPQSSKQHLLDIALSISTHAGLNLAGAGANDVRLHIDGTDITSSYLLELREMIDEWDQNELRTQYRAAMDRWLAFADKLGAAYGTNVATERQRAAQLIQTAPLSSLADQIGNYRHGWSGHLHILNFVDQFGLPSAVGLGQVLQRHNQQSGQDIRTIAIKHLTISCGPSATFDPAYNPAATPPRGAISVRFELRYHDPLEDVVAALRRDLDELAETVRERLETILRNVSSGGPIQRRLTALEQQINQARALAEQASRDVTSQDAHLTALENTLIEIRNLVQNL